jgi:hypothetical protein
MMLNNNKLFHLTFIFILLFAGKSVYGGKQDITAVKAMQLFDRREFEAAETAFKQLLQNDPDNTMLNYYYGASRTENGHFSEETLNYLLEAGEDVTPHRVNYYIGVQHHAQNNFDQALKYYNKFRLDVPQEEQEELQLAQKIQQCFNRENPFTNESSSQTAEISERPEEIPVENKDIPEAGLPISEEQLADNALPEEDTLQLTPKTNAKNNLSGMISTPRKMLPDLPGVKTTYTPPAGDAIEFQINSDITYLNTTHFKTEKGEELFRKGKSLQDKVEQNIEKADKLRAAYRSATDPEKKTEIGKQILALENDSYDLKENASQLFSESRQLENQYWQKAGPVAVNNFLVELDKMQRALHPELAKENTGSERIDSTLVISADDLFSKPDIQPSQQQQRKESQLVYKIQIGAYSRGLPGYVERLFKKLSLIRKIENYTDENGVVVYTTGNLNNLEDAKKMQNQVRQEGVEDAFIVPYFNGKRITLEEAKKLEAENDIERD